MLAPRLTGSRGLSIADGAIRGGTVVQPLAAFAFCLVLVHDGCSGVAAPQIEPISRASKSTRFSTIEVTVKYDVPTLQR